jgi:hypothetical protein
MASSSTVQSASAIRDLRLREQFFPGVEELLFDTTTKGYGPLPIMIRKVLRHINGPALRVLIYLYTRSSKYRICYPTVDEIAEELGIHRKNITEPLKALEKIHLIKTHSAGGKRYYLILDPRVAIDHLVQSGQIKDEELFMTNELARELKQAPFQKGSASPKTAGRTKP